MARSSFSELLQTKAARYEAEAKANQLIIEEWVEAVRKLFEQIQHWLATSDPSKILQIEVTMMEVSEPNVGRYQAPRLEIRAFGKRVGIIPKARKTIKTVRPPQPGAPERATGRIDITDELRRYVLYRFPSEDGDRWFIESSSPDFLQPLTQVLFEEALMSYFQ